MVATYIDVFADVRSVLAKTTAARERRLDQSSFSFNTKKGCCQTCGGYGTIKPDSPLVGDVEFTCPGCGGRRFAEDVLSVAYRGKSIADVLDLDVTEAKDFFGDVKPIADRLKVVEMVGLGYLTLGQSSIDLSGGEAQRLKLAVDLMGRQRGSPLYVFDEPTAGLHAVDIQRLVEVFDRLLDEGASIIVVGHNLHLIWASDYIIEMGPGAGKNGGRVVATGVPSEIMRMDIATGLRRRFRSDPLAAR